MISIFTDKKIEPTDKDLKTALGNTFLIWQSLSDYTKKAYPGAVEEWKYPGVKHGWSFRLKDKNRVIIYLLPRDKFFKVAFVFGNKATDEVIKSNVNENIKTDLKNAKVYAEGRGIRISVKDESVLRDIKQLINIKLSN